MSELTALTDADRALLADAARVVAAGGDGASSESARLRRYLALDRALGRRGAELAGARRDDAFISRVMGALPPDAPAPVDERGLVGIGQAVMRLLGLPATLVIIASFHRTFEWQHWIAAAVLAVAPVSLLLHGLRAKPVRIRDLVYGGALLGCLSLTILALAQALDSRLAHAAGWCCFVLGLAMLAATWTARLANADIIRRFTPVELFVCHQLGIVAFLGGACLVLHS